MNAAEMVQCCFRHQHPEAYGRQVPAFAYPPPTLRYGSDQPAPDSREILPEERMGLSVVYSLAVIPVEGTT